MIKHTFLDKSCTIVKGVRNNLGLNPVGELNYGKKTSRVLVHFDEQELKTMYNNNDLGDINSVKHILRLTNCMSQDSFPYNKELNDGGLGTKERASSFDVIAFALPKNFDAGRGFDEKSDFWTKSNREISKYGCTWYNCASNNPWEEPGVYSIETLLSSASTDIIIARQHFDFGNEDFCLDITEWVNKVLKEEVINHGIGIAFAPELEELGSIHTEIIYKPKTEYVYDDCGEIVSGSTIMEPHSVMTSGLEDQEYVGFFTDNTNTFFHPYLETICNNTIMDDRAQFYIGKENKLYLYSIVNGEYVNLDNIPTCNIDGIPFEVKQAKKGVYYAIIEPSKIKMSPNAIYYDTWSNLALNGEEMEDAELEFVALPSGNYFQIGAAYPMKDNLIPSVSGIDDMEELNQGEVRRVIVDFRKKYSTDRKDLLDTADYRIYVNDGVREITIYDYSPVEKTFMSNFFYINTNELIPGLYHVDIRVKSNGEVRHYKDKLRFKVISDITEFYV